MSRGADAAVSVAGHRAQALLDAVLPAHGTILASRHEAATDSFLLTPVAATGQRAPIRMTSDGTHVADLAMSLRFRWRTQSQTLTIDESRFSLFLPTDRQPLARFEFRSDSTNTPQSHWHLHAERGSFGALLARTRDRGGGRADPSRLSSLHFPLGGPHFRPTLSDVLEFVVAECGVDAHQDWRRAVADHRTTWRREEAAATARQFPAETASAIRQLGWSVRPPEPRKVPEPFVSVLAR